SLPPPSLDLMLEKPWPHGRLHRSPATARLIHRPHAPMQRAYLRGTEHTTPDRRQVVPAGKHRAVARTPGKPEAVVAVRRVAPERVGEHHARLLHAVAIQRDAAGQTAAVAGDDDQMVLAVSPGIAQRQHADFAADARTHELEVDEPRRDA